MKKKSNRLLQRKRHIVALFTLLVAFVVVGCLYIDEVDIRQEIDGQLVDYAKAGTEATFKIKGHIDVAGDPRNDKRMVVGFCAPKSWNLTSNVEVTYTESQFESGTTQSMTLIPSTEQLGNRDNQSWTAALTQVFGVGTNILEDMEWVAFWSKPYNGVAGHIEFDIHIHVKNVGMKNLRFKPGFFINSTDDNFSTSNDAWKYQEGGCFEVVEGEGLVTDFCSQHFNKTTPLMALQNDFVTFSFIGDVGGNTLVDADKIYFEATAVGSNGQLYTVNEKSVKTLMKRENQYTNTYNITLWPEGFFNIPEGTEIVDIEYAFTNADGSISVTQSDDDFVMMGTPLPGQKEPFIYTFICE